MYELWPNLNQYLRFCANDWYTIRYHMYVYMMYIQSYFRPVLQHCALELSGLLPQWHTPVVRACIWMKTPIKKWKLVNMLTSVCLYWDNYSTDNICPRYRNDHWTVEQHAMGDCLIKTLDARSTKSPVYLHRCGVFTPDSQNCVHLIVQFYVMRAMYRHRHLSASFYCQWVHGIKLPSVPDCEKNFALEPKFLTCHLFAWMFGIPICPSPG